MNTVAAAEIYWTAFKALTKKERDAVVEKMLKDKEFIEDMIDIVIIEQRREEPSRSLEEYLEKRKNGKKFSYPKELENEDRI